MNDYEQEQYEQLLKTQFEIKPCPRCGGKGSEQIGEGSPLSICGIPVSVNIGNIVICSVCGFRSRAYREPWKAIADWNSYNNTETQK